MGVRLKPCADRGKKSLKGSSRGWAERLNITSGEQTFGEKSEFVQLSGVG